MNKYYIITLAVAFLLFAGCKKDLDLTPKDTISDATFWKSASDFKLAANELHRTLPGINWDVVMDGQSDIEFNVPNSISNGTYQVSETDGNWNTPYVHIRRANTIIEKAAISLIATEVKTYTAEAKFFRAFSYWKLFRLYGGVPLITKVLDITDKDLYAPRATRKEIVDLIIKDLTEAAADLPEQKNLAAGDIGRITKGAANTLKARVALFEGTWGKYRGETGATAYLDIAIEAARTVMNSAQYSLFNGKGDQSYRYLFIEEGDDAAEGILDRRYQRSMDEQNISHLVAIGNLLPTKKLADMYLCKDGLPIDKSSLFQGYNTRTSEFQNRDPRMTMTLLIPGTSIPMVFYPIPVTSWPFYPQRNTNTGYINYKYLSEDAYSNTAGYNFTFDYHILRYAELLLIYAEATYEKNGTISDADLNKSINLLRQRANMPPLTNAFVTANGLDMKKEIRRERTIELAFEGFRYDDLRRWKTAENELPMDVKGIKIVGTAWKDPIMVDGANRNPYGDASWQSKTDASGFIIAERGRVFDPAKHYLRPLPTKEILLNDKLAQNPGW